MSRICDLCGKRPSVGNSVSHANNKTKRRWVPNLQTVKVLDKGTVRTIRVCTTCIRSGKVTKVPYDHSGVRAQRKAAAATAAKA